MSTGFELNKQLENDSFPVCSLDLCQVRLMNDSRFPWLLLIPQRPQVSELFDLTVADQTTLWEEINKTAQVFKIFSDATKMNVANLGNIVSQLHIHIVARSASDAAWPGPVWGVGKAVPYDTAMADKKIDRLASLVLASFHQSE